MDIIDRLNSANTEIDRLRKALEEIEQYKGQSFMHLQKIARKALTKG